MILKWQRAGGLSCTCHLMDGETRLWTLGSDGRLTDGSDPHERVCEALVPGPDNRLHRETWVENEVGGLACRITRHPTFAEARSVFVVEDASTSHALAEAEFVMGLREHVHLWLRRGDLHLGTITTTRGERFQATIRRAARRQYWWCAENGGQYLKSRVEKDVETNMDCRNQDTAAVLVALVVFSWQYPPFYSSGGGG